MPKTNQELQALIERIENLECGYTLGDIAYLKAHYDMLYRRAERLKKFVEKVSSYEYINCELGLLALRDDAIDILKALE